jgi:hypothetical protein
MMDFFRKGEEKSHGRKKASYQREKKEETRKEKRQGKEKSSCPGKNIKRLMEKQFVFGLLVLVLLVSACGVSDHPGRVSGLEAAVSPPSTTVEESPKIETMIEEELLLEKRPADSQEPAAGICAEDRQAIVIVDVGVDSPPSPRCLIIYTDSVLKFKNSTPNQVEIEVMGKLHKLGPGMEGIIDQKAGDYLERGVHRLNVEGGFIPEIWVK